MSIGVESTREQTRARYPDEQGYVERDGVRVFWEGYGDGPTAVAVSKAVRDGLEAAGIRIVPLTELPSLKH